MAKRTVYPVAGRYLSDVPHVAHDCTDARCVESGAFTPDPPPPDAADTTNQDPADAGSSVSTED